MKQIEPLEAGDSKRTAFSAELMNEIIAAVNSWITAKGGGGTKIYHAEAGSVIYSSGSLAPEGSEPVDPPAPTVIYDSRDTWL